MQTKRLKKGDTVIITYDEKFRKEYPFTFNIFNRRIGVLKKRLKKTNDTLWLVTLSDSGIETFVDYAHLCAVPMTQPGS